MTQNSAYRKKTENKPIIVKCANCNEEHESNSYHCIERKNFIQKKENEYKDRQLKKQQNKDKSEQLSLTVQNFPALPNKTPKDDAKQPNSELSTLKEELNMLRSLMTKLESKIDKLLKDEEEKEKSQDEVIKTSESETFNKTSEPENNTTENIESVADSQGNKEKTQNTQ